MILRLVFAGALSGLCIAAWVLPATGSHPLDCVAHPHGESSMAVALRGDRYVVVQLPHRTGCR